MKRLGSSDSLGALMSMCPTSEEHNPGSNHMYSSREYQSMVDEDGFMEEQGHVPEKKRRLSLDQVKALEISFEVENKLEPERKVKLAQELGLQPRQVAVWFQNRRARWKTKQLERDYGLLKSSFDALKHNYDSLHRDKESLLKQIRELKSKLNEEDIKDEANLVSESDEKVTFLEPITEEEEEEEEAKLKDGQSDSDSSAILNGDHSPNGSNSSSGFVQNQQISSNSMPFRFNSSSSTNCLVEQSSVSVYHPQFVKMEEHNFFGGEEDCDFFSDEQPPTLHWDFAQISGLE